MTFLHALLLGVIEGITEFLPISSTGHLILASNVLLIPQTPFVTSFEIAIQLGAILSVVVLYWRKLALDRAVQLRVLAAFLPTAVLGFVLHDIVKMYLLTSANVVLWAMLIGGIALIMFEKTCMSSSRQARTDIASLPISHAMWIGVAQSVAMVPGVSRAAATIVGGMMLGMKRTAIVEFSFLLAVPTMLAATALDLFKTSAMFTSTEVMQLGVGFVTAFIVALAAVKWLLGFVRSHTFTGFGIYRIVVALILWMVVQ